MTHFFSMIDIAQVCHEANRAIQEAIGDPELSPGWHDAPEWQRDSAIEGVVKAIEGDTPEQLHESWCEYKKQGGWVYGKAKNPVAKTHPCLLPYDQLPEEQKAKDQVFGAIVLTLDRLNRLIVSATAEPGFDDGYGNEPPKAIG